MSASQEDVRHMARALSLARRGLGRTAPNPAVGCVLVRSGEVIGEGWHRQAGTPHAEVNAIADAGDAAGATAYVTLEPCNHTGRTGPCTEALMAAGVTRVVAGAVDPNPQVAGAGLKRLEAAGIRTSVGVLGAECQRLIEPFASWILRGRPLVTLKVASTLDGRIATSSGHSRWVTGAAAREEVHRLRDQQDAICVGAGTVRADDPLLTTRLLDGGGRDPLRVVVSGTLDLPGDARVFGPEAKTVIVTGEQGPKAEALVAAGVDVAAVGTAESGVDLGAMLTHLGERQITSLLVEGGQKLATSLLRRRLVDRLLVYIAPKVVGGDGLGWAGPLGIRTMDGAITLADVSSRAVGQDICIEGRCVYRDH